MRCQWDLFLYLLPPWLRNELDSYSETLLELHMRSGQEPELIMIGGSVCIKNAISKDDIFYCINAATKYSPWTSATMSKGFITAPGGHRIGICGIFTEGTAGIGNITSLCLRVARDFPGISTELWKHNDSILIIGQPGCGKTTLLRDLIRRKSDFCFRNIAVIDEKSEIFPFHQQKPCFPAGKRTDILTGFTKSKGIEMLLRNMSPGIIAVDEITAAEDCNALTQASHCGVKLFATAHAECISDLNKRPIYKQLMNSRIFESVVIMQPDKTWKVERVDK